MTRVLPAKALLVCVLMGAALSAAAEEPPLVAIDPDIKKLCQTSVSCENALQRYADLNYADMVNRRCKFIQRTPETDKLLDGVHNELNVTQSRFSRQIPSDVLTEKLLRPVTEQARLTFCGQDQRAMVRSTLERKPR